MTTALGPTFGAELIAAGLGNVTVLWGSDGAVAFGPGTTTAQQNAVNVVVAAHNAVKSNLITYAETARNTKSNAGVMVSVSGTNFLLGTNKDSRTDLTQAIVLVNAVPSSTFQWEYATGLFITLTGTQLNTIGVTAAQHVQNCYAVKQAVVAAINAGTITTNAQIDAQFATVTP
jgi:hypothetical protein